MAFQFNYAEPFSMSSFYNATYFQNIYDSRHHSNEKSERFATNSEVNHTQGAGIVERSIESEQNGLTGKDLTAAQLYESIEKKFNE